MGSIAAATDLAVAHKTLKKSLVIMIMVQALNLKSIL
jgi:hypothetical protein